MSDEINEVLKDKWFVVSATGCLNLCKNEAGAEAKAHSWDESFSEYAPHHAVQLQVKGTLPEGVIMPKYKVGDRVAHDDGSVGTVRATQIRYLINFYSANFLYADDNLKPAPPADPMREEFEQTWPNALAKQDDGEYCNVYTRGAWEGFKLAKAGAK